MVPPCCCTRARASSRAVEETSPERTNSAPESSAMLGRDKATPVGDHVDSSPAMSTNPRIYLDFNATAPIVPAARNSMTAALEIVGNPSSIHAEGRAARDLVERARNQ